MNRCHSIQLSQISLDTKLMKKIIWTFDNSHDFHEILMWAFRWAYWIVKIVNLPETVNIENIQMLYLHWSYGYYRQIMFVPDNHLMDYVANCRPNRAARLAHRSMERIHSVDSGMLVETVAAIGNKNFDLKRVIKTQKKKNDINK